uniref:Nucleotide-diphospho-sugar transferase domain-containing protein n=1 Tax=Ananas comosus var. bracteatus TaxID=296719 RepID=A0A6V7QTQ6_ANACO
MDPKAFERCRSLHPHCYFLETRGADYKSEKIYMTKDYLEMMWGRNKFQQTILELGYNFLFTDVDILWFRNPLRHIAIASHIAISSDFFVGDPDSLVNFPNGGFLYVRSCEKTVEFYKNWQLSRDKYPGKHEQNVFNLIKGELSARLKVKIQFLDTAYCSGFCQLAKDLNRVCTVHANCCIGLAGKLHDLRSVLQDWKKYRAGSLAERMTGKFQWTVPGICIH